MAWRNASVQSNFPSPLAPNLVRLKSRLAKVGALMRARISGICAHGSSAAFSSKDSHARASLKRDNSRALAPPVMRLLMKYRRSLMLDHSFNSRDKSVILLSERDLSHILVRPPTLSRAFLPRAASWRQAASAST